MGKITSDKYKTNKSTLKSYVIPNTDIILVLKMFEIIKP